MCVFMFVFFCQAVQGYKETQKLEDLFRAPQLSVNILSIIKRKSETLMKVFGNGNIKTRELWFGETDKPAEIQSSQIQFHNIFVF